MTGVPAANVLTPEGLVGPAVVEVADGRVTAVRPARESVPDRTVVPGFVDLQVNGIDDVDVAVADGGDWDRLDHLLLAQGVTTWCPTLVTAPLDAYAPALERIAEAAARGGARPAIAGAHLEGPFIARPGAHPPSLLRPVDRSWLGALPPVVRVITLAPELDGAADVTPDLVRRGVLVAAGHSAASTEQVGALAAAGARLVTHLFNGMPPFHHRDPGVAGAALVDDRLAVSLIADLVHVHETAVAVAFRAKPRGTVVLVTDSVAWRARAVGGVAIEVRDGAPRLPDGTLAGSALTMDRAIANVVGRCGVTLEDAVTAAAATPAALLGLTDRGRITPGARADLVALDPDLAVAATWVGGALAWEHH